MSTTDHVAYVLAHLIYGAVFPFAMVLPGWWRHTTMLGTVFSAALCVGSWFLPI